MMGVKETVKKIFRKAKREAQVVKGEKSKDKIFSSSRIFSNEELAKSFFEESRKRLFDVNAWSFIPRAINSNFQLYSSSGERSFNKRPAVNDFIRIELPGPFPENWVKVVDVKEEENFSEFTVTPSVDPTKKENNKEIEHFFRPEARSTFKVERKFEVITAYEIGKNESVNVKQPEAGNRPVTNALVAEGGWVAFQKIQWENLTDYLIDKI